MNVLSKEFEYTTYCARLINPDYPLPASKELCTREQAIIAKADLMRTLSQYCFETFDCVTDANISLSTIHAYILSGKLKGIKYWGKWFIIKEDWIAFKVEHKIYTDPNMTTMGNGCLPYKDRDRVRSVHVPLANKVLKRDEYTCKICGRKSPDVILEIDHIKPHSKGGRTVLENLQTLCMECNFAKLND